MIRVNIYFGARTQESVPLPLRLLPQPPPSQGTQESVPWPILTRDPGVQAPNPFLPKVPGVRPQPPPPSALSPAWPVFLGKAQRARPPGCRSEETSPVWKFGPWDQKAPYPPVRFRTRQPRGYKSFKASLGLFPSLIPSSGLSSFTV